VRLLRGEVGDRRNQRLEPALVCVQARDPGSPVWCREAFYARVPTEGRIAEDERPILEAETPEVRLGPAA
jgi:hypothetical protein